MNYKPLKRFGQNYLTDQNTIKKIVDEFNPKENENIVEIGPGRGALTRELLNRVNKITAVEVDNRVIEELSAEFSNLTIINKDFLTIDMRDIFEKDKIRVIGNIPYNITSSIIFKLIENRELMNDSLLMVQYEVAKRLTAEKSTKDYGILSVILNYFSEVKLCFKISPKVFYPKPKIYSAIIHIQFNKKIDEKIDTKLFIQIVKASFGNRRKTLKNSLSNSIFRNYDFTDVGVDIKKRAEALDIEDFLQLTKTVQVQRTDGR